MQDTFIYVYLNISTSTKTRVHRVNCFRKVITFFSFDLKSAYHHIMIAKEDREYWGFQWKDKYYVFSGLPFGISTAGYIFTKVLRDVV